MNPVTEEKPINPPLSGVMSVNSGMESAISASTINTSGARTSSLDKRRHEKLFA